MTSQGAERSWKNWNPRSALRMCFTRDLMRWHVVPRALTGGSLITLRLWCWQGRTRGSPLKGRSRLPQMGRALQWPVWLRRQRNFQIQLQKLQRLSCSQGAGHPNSRTGYAGHQKRPRKNKKFNYQFPNHRPWSPAFTSRSSSWDFCVSMVERRERLIHDRHREEDMVDLSSSSLELTV